jgi:hypothetical protein
MANALKIYSRAKVVNFMNTGTSEEPVWTRMQGFTSGGKELNPKTYSRQYIDEDFERESTTGYSPNIPYTYDRIIGNAVHDKVSEVHDDELVEQTCEILTINTIKQTASMRTYDINPDSDGTETDSYSYSGNFHANGPMTKGTAVISADGLIATFTPTPSV